LFDNLLVECKVTTLWPITSVSITFNSKKAITVTKESPHTFYVKMYYLEPPNLQSFAETVGGSNADYIKLKEIE